MLQFLTQMKEKPELSKRCFTVSKSKKKKKVKSLFHSLTAPNGDQILINAVNLSQNRGEQPSHSMPGYKTKNDKNRMTCDT